jgi:hypothetical protein
VLLLREASTQGFAGSNDLRIQLASVNSRFQHIQRGDQFGHSADFDCAFAFRKFQYLRTVLNAQADYGISVQGDWRHESFFQFLQISPSYRLAHLIATGAQSLASSVHVPRDFPEVVKTYEAFGDVWQTDFWNWWVRRAQYQFGVRCSPRVHKIATVRSGADADQQSFDDVRACLDQYFLLTDLRKGGRAAL